MSRYDEKTEEINMDEIDVKILKCLRANARENASVISDKVNMSVSAVIERIRKLENSGLIQKHTTILNSAKAGKDVNAFLSVSLEHPKYIDRFHAFVKENREILECHYITGDFDYMARISAGSTEELTGVLNDIKEIPGVSLTRTYVVLDNIKQGTSVLPRLP